MAAKKKTKAWKKRSAASKRGWATRRANEKLVKNVRKSKTLSSAKKVILELPKKRRSKQQILEAIPALPDFSTWVSGFMFDIVDYETLKSKPVDPRIQDLQEQWIAGTFTFDQYQAMILTRDWVNALDDEWLHPDGSIALQMSRARHLPETQEARDRMMQANLEGRLDEEINEIAGWLDLPIREIYTLWFSP